MNKFHLLPRRRGVLLGNGIDVHRFNPDLAGPHDRARLRAEFGLDEGSLVVGTVARLVAEKGYAELFEAVAALGPPYVLVVVGPEDPEKRDALPAALIDKARAGGVRFLGMRPDVENIYRALDLFVLASHREGIPRTAMEAAAMGLAIVASDVRGCRQVVEHGVNGSLVPARDAAALAEAIRQLGSDPQLRAKMGAAGRAKALREFDERRVVDLVMQTYVQVARREELPLGGTCDTGCGRTE